MMSTVFEKNLKLFFSNRGEMYIFIFRRDFRLYDNKALIQCVKDAKANKERILPLFIYNDTQINPKRNTYFSHNSVQFLITSLKELDREIQSYGGELYRMHISSTYDEVKELKRLKPSCVYFNMDLTPFARWRDNRLKENFPCVVCEDYTLFSVESKETKTNSGTPYLVVSALYKKHEELHKLIPRPQSVPSKIPFEKDVGIPSPLKGDETKFYTENPNILVEGGRGNGLSILKEMSNGGFDNYTQARDHIDWDSTTHLSAYLKYGCISIREAYYTTYERFGIHSDFNRELYFREFYTDIAWFYPRVLKGQLQDKNKAYDTNYNVEWDENKKFIDAWKKGNTGFPLVDAGMREMNTRGYMHNRSRMNVASLFCKNMFQDWRVGERYFATQLVDYDPIQNNAGWQWSAGIGTDAGLFYRIFNPFLQMKYDSKELDYVKRWVPELRDVPVKDIKVWEISNVRERYPNIDYPAPIIDHRKCADIAKDKFYSSKRK